MKLKNIFTSLLVLAATGTVATTMITSCSYIDSDILNNMVDTGDASKFASYTGSNGAIHDITLKDEIHTALTDKDSTDAFKHSIVDKILVKWFNGFTDSAIKTKKNEFNKAINKDWDSQIQQYKDSHYNNWQYYFQNEVLNPVGGTKNKWKESKYAEKVRDYFLNDSNLKKYNYMSVPKLSSYSKWNSTDSTFYKYSSLDTDRTKPFVNFNSNVSTNISGTLDQLLGSGGLNTTGGNTILNPDWWPTINFYATANPTYATYIKTSTFNANNSRHQDQSFALLQQIAFEDYATAVKPMSTGLATFNYSMRGTDMKNIYNADVITSSSGTKSGEGDDPPPPGLLDKPSYAFPCFQDITDLDPSKQPNKVFDGFANNFVDDNYFLKDRGDSTGTDGKLGLTVINGNPSGSAYSQKADTLTLISQAADPANADAPYETYIAPVLDMFQGYKSDPVGANINNIPMVNTGEDVKDTADANRAEKLKRFFPGAAGNLEKSNFEIMGNFLFADADGTNKSVLENPYASQAASDLIYENGVLNLGHKDGDGNYDFYDWINNGCELFNKNYAWSEDSAKYIINTIRLVDFTGPTSSETNVPLPYIMTRTAAGATVAGIDGIDYLKGAKVAQPLYVEQDFNSKWRPGEAFSQERENQILKFHTIYDNSIADVTKQVSGVNVIKGTTSPSGPVIDYLSNNFDNVVLDAFARIMDANDGAGSFLGINDGYYQDSTPHSYYDDNLLGVKSVFNGLSQSEILNTGNGIWNNQLRNLLNSISLLTLFQTIVSDFDTNNKKLTDWGTSYRKNAFFPASAGDDTIYQNGLAEALPIVESSPTWTVALPFTKDAPWNSKTFFSATRLTADDNFKDALRLYSPTTTYNATFSFQNIFADLLVGKHDATVNINGIIETYDAWTNGLQEVSNMSDTNYGLGKPTISNHGNKQAYQYKYSENILTYNDYTNNLLWKFGGGDGFASWIKMMAIKQYINDIDTTVEDDYIDQITSFYSTSKLINGDSTNLLSLFNANNNNLLTFDDYKTGLVNAQFNKLKSVSNIDASNVNLHSYSQDAIDYQTYLATIARLQANNYVAFTDYLNKSIITTNETTAYITWIDRDLRGNNFNADITTPDTNSSGEQDDSMVDEIYGWKDNYFNMLNNIYQNTNIANTPPSSYVDFSSDYFRFAPMPIKKAGATYPDPIDAMGFLGLQTESNNTLSSYPNVKDTLFTHFNTAYDKFVNDSDLYGKGTLYNYGSRDQLVSSIDQIRGNYKLLLDRAKFIDKQTGVFGSVVDEMQDAATSEEAYNTLRTHVLDDSENGLLKDQFFEGYNKDGTANPPTLELTGNMGGNNPAIADNIGTSYAVSRVRVMQINTDDIVWGQSHVGDSTADHLKNILGDDLLDYLVAQAAMDSSLQNKTIDAVIKEFCPNKITVYDRRLNDKLGSSWVNNYKSSN